MPKNNVVGSMPKDQLQEAQLAELSKFAMPSARAGAPIVDSAEQQQRNQQFQEQTRAAALGNSVSRPVLDNSRVAGVNTTGVRRGVVRRDTPPGGFAKGGTVSSASSRADGCAQRGKTKGRFV